MTKEELTTICPIGYRPLVDGEIIKENDIFTSDKGKTFCKVRSIGRGYEGYFYPIFRVGKRYYALKNHTQKMGIFQQERIYCR
jgi:hypothetical protein